MAPNEAISFTEILKFFMLSSLSQSSPLAKPSFRQSGGPQTGKNGVIVSPPQSQEPRSNFPLFERRPISLFDFIIP
jgi:hypothetical protein